MELMKWVRLVGKTNTVVVKNLRYTHGKKTYV